MDHPTVSIIILNWNGVDDTVEWLDFHFVRMAKGIGYSARTPSLGQRL